MKSIAIKTNNSQAIEYITLNLKKMNLENLNYSCKNFKHFTNIIIHYKGANYNEFFEQIASLLSFSVIYEFEEVCLKKIILSDYFYFTRSESTEILENCFNIIMDSDSISKKKFTALFNSFLNYIKLNKCIYLTGFINFRLTKYFRNSS